MRARRPGRAPNVDIASVTRAVGRIVVCVEAAAEVRTQSRSSLPALDPRTVLDIARSTSSLCEATKPGPAKAMDAVLTNAKMATSRTVESTAARPGVRELSRVSSVTLTAQSQPQ